MNGQHDAIDLKVASEATQLVKLYVKHVTNPSYWGVTKYILASIEVDGKKAAELSPRNRAFVHQAINQCWVELGHTVPLRVPKDN